MLSAAEVTSMRSVQAAALPEMATITRRTFTPDGMGGQVEAASAFQLPCRASVASAQQAQLVAGQLNERTAWRITFAANADVRETDMITVGTRSFEVLTLLAGGSWETARVALCALR
jgi:hypothetical protein